MQFLRQGAAVTVKMGPFVDAGDAVTAETELTIQKADVRVSKNGAAFGAVSADQGQADAGAAHDENGYYAIALAASDTDTVGRLRVAIAATGALPVWQDFMVLDAAAFDAVVDGRPDLRRAAGALAVRRWL